MTCPRCSEEQNAKLRPRIQKPKFMENKASALNEKPVLKMSHTNSNFIKSNLETYKIMSRDGLCARHAALEQQRIKAEAAARAKEIREENIKKMVLYSIYNDHQKRQTFDRTRPVANIVPPIGTRKFNQIKALPLPNPNIRQPPAAPKQINPRFKFANGIACVGNTPPDPARAHPNVFPVMEKEHPHYASVHNIGSEPKHDRYVFSESSTRYHRMPSSPDGYQSSSSSSSSYLSSSSLSLSSSSRPRHYGGSRYH